MSPTHQKIQDLAAAHDKYMRADDDRFSQIVIVTHEDGSTFRWHNAWAARVTADEYLGPSGRSIRADWAAWDADPFGLADYPRESLNEIGWLIVFTEHHGFHLFHCGDLLSYAVYRRVDVIPEFEG